MLQNSVLRFSGKEKSAVKRLFKSSRTTPRKWKCLLCKKLNSSSGNMRHVRHMNVTRIQENTYAHRSHKIKMIVGCTSDERSHVCYLRTFVSPILDTSIYTFGACGRTGHEEAYTRGFQKNWKLKKNPESENTMQTHTEKQNRAHPAYGREGGRANPMIPHTF